MLKWESGGAQRGLDRTCEQHHGQGCCVQHVVCLLFFWSGKKGVSPSVRTTTCYSPCSCFWQKAEKCEQGETSLCWCSQGGRCCLLSLALPHRQVGLPTMARHSGPDAQLCYVHGFSLLQPIFVGWVMPRKISQCAVISGSDGKQKKKSGEKEGTQGGLWQGLWWLRCDGTVPCVPAGGLIWSWLASTASWLTKEHAH